jgi:ferrous iron transport protein A
MCIMLTTSDLKAGFRVRLVDFGVTDTSYRQKLLSFGMTRGVDVQIVRVAPLGCPVQIEVRGASIALRFEEARHLRWEKI